MSSRIDRTLVSPPTAATLVEAGAAEAEPLPQLAFSPRISGVTPQPSLLARVARGDASAVRDCLLRFGGLVWSLARRLSTSQADAEDAVQEIFLDLWKSAARYDATLGSEATFVAVIARRRLVDRRRRAQRHVPPPTFHDPPPQWAVVPQELAAEAALATRALATLREEQRRVLVLTACHGFSHEEVAASTGMPLGTVKAHARRGLIAIRKVLEPPHERDARTARMEKTA